MSNHEDVSPASVAVLRSATLVHAYELIVEAPKGYRPSDWPERLMNFDECAELEDDLVYTKYTKTDRVLVVRADLLDPFHPGVADRALVFGQIMSFAKSNDFSITMDPQLPTLVPTLFERVKAFLEERGLKYRLAELG